MRLALTFPGVHRRAGVERVVAECVRFLAGRGHDVDVYANDYEPEDLPRITYKFVPVKKKPGFLRPGSFFNACSKLLDVRAYDAVGTFGAECPFGGTYWAGSVHRAWMEYSKKFRPPLSLARVKQQLNPMNHAVLRLEARHFRGRKYRQVIALTEDLKRDLTRFYDVPARDIRVLSNGYAASEFNLDRTQQSRAAMRQKLGYAASDRVVIFVANELERKGFRPLLRAMASLNFPNARLLVVGRVTSATVDQEIQELGMSSRVQFAGPSRDVASFYAAADVFALPTQYEPWGLVIVEALACGVPVLTSRLAGAAITIDEHRTGALLDRPDDVNEIAAKLKPLLDGEHADRQAISESVFEYSWDRVLLRYEQILMESAGGSGSPVVVPQPLAAVGAC